MSRFFVSFLKLLTLPVRLLGRLLSRLTHPVVRPIVERVDSSGYLSNLIDQASSSMSTQRGLLLMVGTGLLALSLLTSVFIVAIMVSTDSFDRSLYWICIPFALLHVGVLVGFTGIMLATPLGQGYKDQ